MSGTPGSTNGDKSRRAISVDLGGLRFNVVSDAEEHRVREVVDFVNRRVDSIREGTRRAQSDQIALLAALNLAEELFAEREKNERLKRLVRERSIRMLASIDAIARDLEGRRDDRTSTSLPGS